MKIFVFIYCVVLINENPKFGAWKIHYLVKIALQVLDF